MPAARRVLVTRAAQQGSALAEQLRAHGLDPVLIPAIETVAPSTFAPLDHALAHLDRFHWALFTSANAVDVFAARLVAPRPPALGTTVRIAAIGPSTARVLEALGLPVHLVPPQAVAESLAEALLPHARQGDGAPARFLLVRAEDAREHLPDTLREAGAEVTIAPAYQTIVPPASIELLRQLFAEPQRWPAAVTFTSSSTARNLLALCEAAGVPLPEEALRISIGPITSNTLQELGLPPHAEAPEATVSALAATVLQVLDRPR